MSTIISSSLPSHTTSACCVEFPSHPTPIGFEGCGTTTTPARQQEYVAQMPPAQEKAPLGRLLSRGAARPGAFLAWQRPVLAPCPTATRQHTITACSTDPISTRAHGWWRYSEKVKGLEFNAKLILKICERCLRLILKYRLRASRVYYGESVEFFVNVRAQATT